MTVEEALNVWLSVETEIEGKKDERSQLADDIHALAKQRDEAKDVLGARLGRNRPELHYQVGRRIVRTKLAGVDGEGGPVMVSEITLTDLV